MNKYIIIALSAILIFGLSACDKRLELKPFDAIDTELAFQTSSDFTNAINGVYTAFIEDPLTGLSGYYGGQHILMPDVLADNVILCSEGRRSKQSIYIWEMSGDLTWGLLWTDAYKVINRATQVLENIDILDAGDFKNNIEGQALALRALAHFDLARAFSKAPAQAGGSDLGVPYITSSDASQKPSRPSVAETYNQIVAEMEAASQKIGENGVGKLGKTSVDALLTRVYLYMGDWAKVNERAASVISVSNPADAVDFANVWIDESDSGVLFKVQISDQDNISPGVEYSQTGLDGVRSEYVADYDFYNKYTDTDVRKAAYFTTSTFAGKDFNHIKKYSSRPNSDLNVTDIKVIRTAEVYLNRAEARANMGMDAEALADLDIVRANRYTDFAAGSETGNDLKAAIDLQRRLELAFEGHRIYDIKRKGESINRSSYGDEADGSGLTAPASASTMSAGDTRFEFPIPQSEINANTSMQQNPGY